MERDGAQQLERVACLISLTTSSAQAENSFFAPFTAKKSALRNCYFPGGPLLLFSEALGKMVLGEFMKLLASTFFCIATLLFVQNDRLAQETAKGGGKKLLELSSSAQVAQVEAGDVVVTTCPKCRAVTQTRVKATAKGGGSGVETAQVHTCPGCGAKVETSGHGKGKKDKVTHVCSHCGSKKAFCSVLKKKDAE